MEKFDGINKLFGKGENFRRPVLVFKKFSRNSFLALPLTSREKIGTYFAEIHLGGVRRWVILSQAKTLDARRLTSLIGVLDAKRQIRVREQFIKLICS